MHNIRDAQLITMIADDWLAIAALSSANNTGRFLSRRNVTSLDSIINCDKHHENLLSRASLFKCRKLE